MDRRAVHARYADFADLDGRGLAADERHARERGHVPEGAMDAFSGCELSGQQNLAACPGAGPLARRPLAPLIRERRNRLSKYIQIYSGCNANLLRVHTNFQVSQIF